MTRRARVRCRVFEEMLVGKRATGIGASTVSALVGSSLFHAFATRHVRSRTYFSTTFMQAAN